MVHTWSNAWRNGRCWKGIVASCIVASCIVWEAAVAAKTKPPLDAVGIQKMHRGVIVVQQQPFAAWNSAESFAQLVATARSTHSLAPKGDEGWPLYFMAFLKQPPGAKQLNLVWYRIGKRMEQIDFTEFNVSPSELTLQSNVTLTSSQGFHAGDRLEGRLTRLIGGKEIVFARCQLQLE